MFLKLPTSACKIKIKIGVDGGAMEKQHVLPLLCVIYFYFENGFGAQLDGMKRKICKEFWAPAHSFGMSKVFFFPSHGGEVHHQHVRL